MKWIIFLLSFLAINSLYAASGDHPQRPGDRGGKFASPSYNPSQDKWPVFRQKCLKERSAMPEWEACALEFCRHEYCKIKNMISSQVLPAQCYATVNTLNQCVEKNLTPGPAPVPPEQAPTTQCPYMWKVVFTQTGTHNSNRCFAEGLEADRTSEVNAFAQFENVVIFSPHPDRQPAMTSAQWRACRGTGANRDLMETPQKSVGTPHFLMYGDNEVMGEEVVFLQVGESQQNDSMIISVSPYDSEGIPLRQFVQQISAFSTPSSRKDVSFSGSCGISYRFTPVPFSE